MQDHEVTSRVVDMIGIEDERKVEIRREFVSKIIAGAFAVRSYDTSGSLHLSEAITCTSTRSNWFVQYLREHVYSPSSSPSARSGCNFRN